MSCKFSGYRRYCEHHGYRGYDLVPLLKPSMIPHDEEGAGARMGVPVGAVDIDRRRLERERGLAQSSPPSPTTEQSPDSRHHGGANAPNDIATAHDWAEQGWHHRSGSG